MQVQSDMKIKANPGRNKLIHPNPSKIKEGECNTLNIWHLKPPP